jgi:hypothetical protein
MLSLGLLAFLLQAPAPPTDPAPKPPESAVPEPATPPSNDATAQRTQINLLGQTDAAAGESRRNENVQLVLVDNNALKELNIRLGVSATPLTEFRPERGYFGAEYGQAPTTPLHLAPPPKTSSFHGRLFATHQNSVFAARSFFQVGGVKPARENQYGFQLALPPWRQLRLTLDASQQKLRGQVNGNVLVPTAAERLPDTTDPAMGRTIARWLAAYPNELPNRPDINTRALNTNAPQVINNHDVTLRLNAGRQWATQYAFTSQTVDAFQLVAGQNPDTTTKSHKARLMWTRDWSPRTTSNLTLGFDRLGSLLVPEPNAVGPLVITPGLSQLGPEGLIPIDRALNAFRYAVLVRHVRSRHTVTAGFEILRRQLNGRETDVHRGFFGFANDFGADSITNLRRGAPTQYLVSIGEIDRGFRNFDLQFYLGDSWQATSRLTVQLGLRYQPVTTPVEVQRKDVVPYPCDCNNLAPQFGLAYRLPGVWGVMRAAYGLHFGEIFPATYQQIRFSPPRNLKRAVARPRSILDPLNGVLAPPNLYLLDPHLRVPYVHQYSFAWELGVKWRLTLGYVGSRQHKLLTMWFENRGDFSTVYDMVTATVNERRRDPNFAERRRVINGSRGYYDAARATFNLPRWRGLAFEASYWWSKAIDGGTNYTNTAYDADSRQSRSQWEYLYTADMRSLSSFDQPHAFLWRGAWDAPKRAGAWTFSSVILLKSGTPFNVVTGSDGPGYGNVDGNGGDRPHILRPEILGRTIGHPDTSRQMLPRDAFAFQAVTDRVGNLGRNVFRKGLIRNVNAALARTWALPREQRLTLRAESINFFNTPQFAEPGFELAAPNFGYITNTLNDGRVFRFTLQFAW